MAQDGRGVGEHYPVERDVGVEAADDAPVLGADSDAPDEAFVRKYVESRGVRPLEVSHNFGNYYTKVLRENPCENVVIEAMIRKRFLYVGPAGWPAVTGLFHKLLKK